MVQPTESELIPQRKTFLPKVFFRYSAIELLIALVVLIVTAPAVQDLPGADLVEPALLTVVMISAVLVVGGKRRSFIAALVLLIPALLGKWCHHFLPDKVSPFLYLVPATI